MNIRSESVNLIELCEKDPERANKLVSNASAHAHREFTAVPWTLFISRPLSSELIGRMVIVQGAVIRAYEVFLKNVTSEQICIACSAVSSFTDAETREREKRPFCESCGSQHVKIERHFADAIPTQSIRIQDMGNSTAMSETIEVLLEGEYVGRFAPGDKLCVTGVVMRRWKPFRNNEPMVSTLYVRALSVVCDQMTGASSLDSEVHFRALADLPSHARRKFLIESTCPEIYGQQNVKLALLLSLLSGNTGSGRASIHMLLVGGPGTGKTRLLRCASKLISPSIFVDGARVSYAGLTSCAVRQGKEWVLEAGALVLSDRGVCCIDEFDRLKIGKRGGLLESMEQQTISVAKAGIVTTLSTRCAVIAAVRLHGLLSGPSACERLGISPPLISRFDFIIGIQDDKKEDVAKCEHIFRRCMPQKKSYEEQWPMRLLREYLLRAKERKVRVTQHHSDTLLKYYLKKREVNGRSEHNTVRMLESLVRVAVAHAKLLGREETSDEDIYTSLILAECNLVGGKEGTMLYHRPFDDPQGFERCVEVLSGEYGLLSSK